MILFNIKRSNNIHYFFLATKNVEDLEHVLKENMITGWGIMPLPDIIHTLPHKTKIPKVYVDQYSQLPIPQKGISVLASYYKPEDMQKFLWEILEHPETRQRHQEKSEKLKQHYTWENAMAKDPNPWSLFIK